MFIKNLKTYCYFGAVFLFIVYLFTVNKWLPSLFDYSPLKTVDYDTLEKKDIVYFSVDSTECGENLKETCVMSGWAFCETKGDNLDKELILILKSVNKSYAIYPTITEREDVSNAYAGTKTIVGNNHGYNVTVATVGMKSGIYDLYIYCKENNENYGLVNTGITFKKEGRFMRTLR